jgi:hypothetical protein
MQMLYDSDSFVVVQMVAAPEDTPEGQPQLLRQGFEIVDKRHGREVYLDGSWAELFQARLDTWRDKTPTQEEIESTLEGYAALAQTPLVLH